MDQPVRIGVLSHDETYSVKSIVHAIRELGHIGFVVPPTDLTARIGADGVDIDPEMDVLFNWARSFRSRNTLEVLGALREADASDIVVLNSAQAAFDANHKGASLSQLAAAGVPVPQTIVSAGGTDLTTASDQRAQCVHKPTMGGGGADVALLDRDDDPGIFRRDDTGLIQQYIETNGDAHWDVRALVVGDGVVAAMEREAPDDDWRTNISKGGSGSDVGILLGEARDIAVDTADVLDLDVTGVDLIQSEDGEWGVVETNTPAGWSGLEGATGVNPGPFVAAYSLEQAGVQCDADRIVDLAESIDVPDSVASRSPRFYDIRGDETLSVSGHKRSFDVEFEIDWEAEHSRISPDLAKTLGCQLVWRSDITDDVEDEKPSVKLTVLANGYRESMFPVFDESLDGDGHSLELHLGIFTDSQLSQSSDETPN